MHRCCLRLIVVITTIALGTGACFCQFNDDLRDGSSGPLGQWPDFTPIGFITAPNPDDPEVQTYFYGDWGAIVGEEFIFLQDGKIKLLYHSYHETYLTERAHEIDVLQDWELGYDKVTKIRFTPLALPWRPDSRASLAAHSPLICGGSRAGTRTE